MWTYCNYNHNKIITKLNSTTDCHYCVSLWPLSSQLEEKCGVGRALKGPCQLSQSSPWNHALCLSAAEAKCTKHYVLKWYISHKLNLHQTFTQHLNEWLFHICIFKLYTRLNISLFQRWWCMFRCVRQTEPWQMRLFGSSALHHHIMEPGRQSTHHITPCNWTLAKGWSICDATIIIFTQTVSIIIRTSLKATLLHMF